MAMTTAEKPAYLGVLNAISLAESAAGQYLTAWANVTDDEDLACCLRFVAARETSHGDVFCRRIAELGFSLMPKRDPEGGERLAKFADPRVSDLEKIGPEREDGQVRDVFRDIKKAMADGEYDAMTCNLLGWYIAEEDDSGKRLREAYAAVRERADGRRKTNGAAANGHASADAEAIMACMTQGFGRLEKSLEKLAKAVK
jgi:rubrerythrin